MSLLEYQRRLIDNLLRSNPHTVDPDIDFPVRTQAGLQVHRETILSALTNVLRMTFPTVAALTGSPFFNHVARTFALNNRPLDPVLFYYGDSFPDFLSRRSGSASYLEDVARLDLAIDRAAHQANRGYGRAIPIGPRVEMALHTSLTCLHFNSSADLIRGAVELDSGTEDMTSLLQPVDRHVAIWRSTKGASVKPLSAPVARFLEALIIGKDVTTALGSAVGQTSFEEIILDIQSDLFISSCIQLSLIDDNRRNDPT
jgi:hypothetical protein